MSAYEWRQLGLLLVDVTLTIGFAAKDYDAAILWLPAEAI